MAHLSTAQLTQIRAQRTASLQGSCVHYPAADASDSSGGYTQGWSAGSTYACGITTPTGQGAGVAGMIEYSGAERTALIALPHGTTVTAADRLVSGGLTYEIVHVEKPGGFGIQVLAYCVERS